MLLGRFSCYSSGVLHSWVMSSQESHSWRKSHLWSYWFQALLSGLTWIYLLLGHFSPALFANRRPFSLLDKSSPLHPFVRPSLAAKDGLRRHEFEECLWAPVRHSELVHSLTSLSSWKLQRRSKIAPGLFIHHWTFWQPQRIREKERSKYKTFVWVWASSPRPDMICRINSKRPPLNVYKYTLRSTQEWCNFPSLITR